MKVVVLRDERHTELTVQLLSDRVGVFDIARER